MASRKGQGAMKQAKLEFGGAARCVTGGADRERPRGAAAACRRGNRRPICAARARPPAHAPTSPTRPCHPPRGLQTPTCSRQPSSASSATGSAFARRLQSAGAAPPPPAPLAAPLPVLDDDGPGGRGASLGSTPAGGSASPDGSRGLLPSAFAPHKTLGRQLTLGGGESPALRSCRVVRAPAARIPLTSCHRLSYVPLSTPTTRRHHARPAG